jgi:predicted nucleic acid-binding Zn ribbon protein
MTDIMPHRHCMVCGNAIREGLYCDELCESKLKSAQRRQQLVFVAFVAFMALIIILPSLLRTKG